MTRTSLVVLLQTRTFATQPQLPTHHHAACHADPRIISSGARERAMAAGDSSIRARSRHDRCARVCPLPCLRAQLAVAVLTPPPPHTHTTLTPPTAGKDFPQGLSGALSSEATAIDEEALDAFPDSQLPQAAVRCGPEAGAALTADTRALHWRGSASLRLRAPQCAARLTAGLSALPHTQDAVFYHEHRFID